MMIDKELQRKKGEKEMNKLKTLEDIPLTAGIFDRIKQEAIKWVKVMNGEERDKHYNYRDNTINWIKEFFNITGKDLVEDGK